MSREIDPAVRAAWNNMPRESPVIYFGRAAPHIETQIDAPFEPGSLAAKIASAQRILKKQ